MTKKSENKFLVEFLLKNSKITNDELIEVFLYSIVKDIYSKKEKSESDELLLKFVIFYLFKIEENKSNQLVENELFDEYILKFIGAYTEKKLFSRFSFSKYLINNHLSEEDYIRKFLEDIFSKPPQMGFTSFPKELSPPDKDSDKKKPQTKIKLNESGNA